MTYVENPSAKRKGRWRIKRSELNKLAQPRPAVPEEILAVQRARGSQPIPTLKLKAILNETHEVTAMVDSGATDNFISNEVAETLKCQIRPLEATATTADGSLLPLTGRVRVRVRLGQCVRHMPFKVAAITEDCILGMPFLAQMEPRIAWRDRQVAVPTWNGWEWIEAEEVEEAEDEEAVSFLNHLKEAESEPHPNKADPDDSWFDTRPTPTTSAVEEARGSERWKRVLRDFGEVFPSSLPDGLPPHRAIEHEIKLRDERQQPIHRAPYRSSPAHRKEIQRQVGDLLRKGFITQSSSPWSAGCLLVPKKGGEMRMCIDFRPLNGVTVPDRHPLPRPDDLAEHLRGASVFTKLDLASGYHQVRLTEASRELTGFSTDEGHYHWMVMPFGLTNAPPTFQRLLNTVLRPFLKKFVVVFLDDILIFSADEASHEQHLKAVLTALQREGLYAKASKCTIGVPAVEFCGFRVSREGPRTCEDKVRAVEEWQAPTTVKGVRQFLGFVGFYQRFIKGYSTLVAPLTNLLKKDCAWRWTEVEDRAFREVKRALTTAPVLMLPIEDQEFHLFTDASSTGLGAALMQLDETNQLRPIAFRSRKFNEHERNYTTTEQEMLGVVDTLRAWRHYLQGSEVMVHTDHKALVWFDSQPAVTGRRARWAQTL